MATYKKTNHPGILALEQPEKTCRRWRLTVRHEGKNRYRNVSDCTLTQAREELAKFKHELKQDGINPDLAKLTFAKFADQWQEERTKGGSIAKGTLRKNAYHINLMKPHIGKVEMASLSVDVVKRLMAKLRSEGGKGGKPLSGTTVRNVYATLNTMLEDATSRGALKGNPCDKVKPPKEDTEEKEALSQDEAERLAADLVDGEPKASTVGFLLALACGLRREEICGLRWCDVSARTLRVNHAFTADSHELTDPKTKASRRTIPIDAQTYARLTEWKQVQAAKLESLEIKQTAKTPVVSTRDGGFVHPENFAHSWGRYAKRHDLDGYTLHQLRHTFATLLVAKGVDLVTAAKLMGHGSTAMLEKVYAHVVQENLVNATEIIGSVLFGGTPHVVSFEAHRDAMKSA